MWNKYKYHISLATAGLCYSALSLFSAILTSQKVDAFTQILWRCLFGAITSLIVMLGVFRQNLLVSGKELKYILSNSLILISGFITFILSIYLGTPIAKAIALVYTYPLSLVPLSLIILRDKPTIKQLIAVSLSLISISLLFEVWKMNNLTQITAGEILAFVNSIFYSAILILGRVIRTKTKLHPTKTISYSLLVMVPLLSLIGFSLNIVGIPILKPVYHLNLPGQSWLGLFGLGFFGTTLAMTFLYVGLAKIKPTVAGLLLLTEPIWVTIWGYLFFSQTMTIWGILGMLGIIASVLLV